jgi:uncharacterized HAD superfamily protein
MYCNLVCFKELLVALSYKIIENENIHSTTVNIIGRKRKLKGMRWVELITYTGEMRNACKIIGCRTKDKIWKSHL